MSAPKMNKATGAGGFEDADNNTRNSFDYSKAFLTLQAVFALRGYTLNRKGSGYIVCETATGDCIELETLADVQFLLVQGVQQ